MKQFFREVLNIRERDIQTIKWAELLNRLFSAQLKTNLPMLSPNLTAFDVVNRLMRRDNYMIAFINKGLIDSHIDLPFLGKRVFFPKSLEWNLQKCILDYIFEPNGTSVKTKFLLNSHSSILSASLQRRFRTVALMNLFLSPFILLFQFVFFFFRYAEEFRSRPSAVGTRQWNGHCKWRFREFNELIHIFERRLNMSYPHADAYISRFTSESWAVVSRFVVFVAGSFVAVLMALSFYDEAVLTKLHITTGHTVLWYITVFGVVIAVGRSYIPDEHLVFEPEKLIENIVYHTHFYPPSWREKAHTFEVRDEFALMFELKLALLFSEIFSFILTPYILYFQMPSRASQIVDFVRDFTVWQDGVGHICSFASFNFKKHGNQMYGVPLGTCSSDPYLVSNEGKMEKSFINFQSQNPNWVPEADGQQYISEVCEFATTTGGVINSHSIPDLNGAKIQKASRISESISDIRPPNLSHSGIMNHSGANLEDTSQHFGISTMLLEKIYDFKTIHG